MKSNFIKFFKSIVEILKLRILGYKNKNNPAGSISKCFTKIINIAEIYIIKFKDSNLINCNYFRFTQLFSRIPTNIIVIDTAFGITVSSIYIKYKN